MEDDFEHGDIYDHKAEWCARESIRQDESTIGWIYIGLDIRYNNMAKIGLTTGHLGTRASGSQNPFYTLLCAFKVKEGVSSETISAIENSVINFLSNYYQRIPHYSTRRLSEWFYANPYAIRSIVHDFIYDNYCTYMHAYYCADRGIGVIHSWENSYLL